MPHNAFNPKAKAFVAKQFKFSGVTYEVGAVFPHKDLKVPDYEMRGLWLADLVDFKSQEEIEESALVAAEEARIKKLLEEEEAELAAAGLPNAPTSTPPPPLTEAPAGFATELPAAAPARPKAKAQASRP